MGKVLKHPLRAMGAALTLVGAAIVFVVFFIPIAVAGPKPPGPHGAGGSAPGKNSIQAYVNDHGNVLHEVGADETFTILGKNLNNVHDASWGVQCWNGKFWTEVSNWAYDPDLSSRMLVDVDFNNDCSGMLTQIRINSDVTSKGDHYAYGPMIYVKSA